MCVVKRLSPELRNERSVAARFADEANLVRRLSHGNLTHTLAVGVIDREPFIAQELVEGRDLSEIAFRSFNQGVAIPLTLAVHIAAEIARGLAYAHDFGGLALVHRDVSPPNIRVAYSGDVKLLDFGIATYSSKSHVTMPGMIPGKLAYMAPEQILGKPGDRRSDIYSLGVVLWELATGHAASSLKSAVRGQAPVFPAPSELNPEVPRELEAILARCLACAPGDRFATALDLRAALVALRPAGLDAEAALSKLLGRLYDVEKEQSERVRLVASTRALAQEAARYAAERASLAPPRTTPPSSTDEPPATDTGTATEIKARRRQLVVAFVATLAAGIALFNYFPRAATQSECGTAMPAPRPAAVAPAPAVPPAPPTIPTAPLPVAPLPVALEPLPTPPVPQPRTAVKPAATLASTPAPVPAADPDALVARARAAFARNDFEAALDWATRAVASGATFDGHMVLGNVHLRNQRYAEAEHAYLQAMRAEPRNQDARHRLDLVRKLQSEK
jgi:serine/threonine-protein kinase